MSIVIPGTSTEMENIETTEHKLLIVDDYGLVRNGIRRSLTHFFREFLEAESLESALTTLHRLERGDVIISDLHLTKENPGEGLDFARLSLPRRKEYGIPFILSSGGPQEGDPKKIQAALGNGLIDSFLPKPYDPQTLKQKVLETVRGKLRGQL